MIARLFSWLVYLLPKEPVLVKVNQTSNIKRCAYCHDESWEFKCYCDAAYHKECWWELSKCATLGCNANPADCREAIKALAEIIWLQEGRQPGSDVSNWLRAEEQVFSRGMPLARKVVTDEMRIVDMVASFMRDVEELHDRY